jgi:hypothetical protein
MQKSPSDEIERLLLDLKDDRRDIRSLAAYELGKHNDPRAVMPLVTALSDNDKFVRSWAAGALGKAGAAAVEPLLIVLEGSDAAIGYYAALALGEIGDLRAVPMLAQAIQKGDYDIRPSAANALNLLGDAAALPDRVLADASLTPMQRLRILDSLQDVAHTGEELNVHYTIPDVVAFCTERLQSEDASIRAGAKETLEAVRSSRPEVAAAVQSPQPDARSPLSATVAESSVPELEPLAAPDPGTRKRSLWSRLLGR